MRVALLTHNARAGDAIGNHVAEKLSFFLDSGADVRAFVECGERLHPTLRPHARLLAPEPCGEGWLFLRGCDLVVVEYSQWYPLLGLLPLLVGERPRVLFDYHGVTPPKLWTGPGAEAPTRGARSRGLVWCADAALVHSRFTQRELLGPTNFPEDRTHTLGLAIDTTFWQPGAPARDLRERLGIGPVPLLLFVGRLAPNKRVPLLVDALEQLPGVHAAVVGDHTDVYEAEADVCRRRANERGVADRFHLLGHLTRTELHDAYRSADVFVMPSLHEGFCVPVIEAMACALPVVAARAAALPQTLADAGLTFTPDDADDLAQQVRRVLVNKHEAQPTQGRRSIAIVAPRFGDHFAGGAERSLRTLADILRDAGHAVEVFTTCARTEGGGKNELAEGTTALADLRVHRFAVDPVDDSQPTEHPAHAFRSARLIQALRSRAEAFDAILAGPYLVGLTHDVAEAFPDRTLVVPCFHDEPAAYLDSWQKAYTRTAGVLYHSPDERALAEIDLGVNHPSAHTIGTAIDTEAVGDAVRGRGLVGSQRPYIVYCGRYCPEKGLPILLEFARDYSLSHAERFTFVFMGEGSVPIPCATWARDLGFVSEADKRDVLAGAAALVVWSERESLSLAALEAWAQGTPVLGHRRCAAFMGHLERGSGGMAADDAASFTAALDDLWQNCEAWRERGERGLRYVRTHFSSRDAVLTRLTAALDDLAVPLAERLKQRGLQRAACFERNAWRADFAALVEQVLDAPARAVRTQIEVSPRSDTLTVSIASTSVLVPVRVTNRGSHAVVADGPAGISLHSFIDGGEGRPWRMGGPSAALPGLLMPGQTVAAALPVSVPTVPGTYRLRFRAGLEEEEGVIVATEADTQVGFTLKVTAEPRQGPEGGCAPLLDNIQAAVAEAHALQRLPDGYIDGSLGRFARLKRWIKQKLLNNFKRAYVDVLSRQQSQFNREILNAVRELADCCGTLDHARVRGGTAPAAPALDPNAAPNPEVLRHLIQNLVTQLAETRERCNELHDRLARLEAAPGETRRRDVA